jgi:hypothetical protein
MMEALLITGKRAQELRLGLNETAQSMNDATKDVQSWIEHLSCLLKDLELFAMANDSNHPEQFELLLQKIKLEIDARLKDGQWQCQ